MEKAQALTRPGFLEVTCFRNISHGAENTTADCMREASCGRILTLSPRLIALIDGVLPVFGCVSAPDRSGAYKNESYRAVPLIHRAGQYERARSCNE